MSSPNVEPRIRLPQDSRQNPIQRAMGVPLVTPADFTLGTTRFADVFNFSEEKFRPRAFTGISIVNPSTAASIILSLGEEGSENRNIVCAPNQFFTLDNLTFGPGIIDDTTGERCFALRAALDLALGTPASATIDYSGSGNPTNGMLIEVDGKVFEFSDDESKEPAYEALIPIGASADDSWTAAVNVINNFVQGVFASIDTVGDVVTIESNYGGAFGDGLVVQDGAVPTGAAFSGNLSGGSGGFIPVIHIW